MVGDRVLQRDVHYSVSVAPRYERYIREGRKINRNPVVVLEGVTSIQEGYTFRINDKDHIYFFSILWPDEALPEFLMPEDVILSGWDHAFNKPLCRVRVDGGLPERYNSITQEWERYGSQVYVPQSWLIRARVFAGDTVRFFRDLWG
ncbi:hypothetical protein A3K72_03150 [Candidatus Woesearchaeota archaeon RBG_13_36_6]|nr:MAG: hypothetical protein A3K72_03150 [Candidatus Woesearchaeota archaeon RBG_13_36_6]